jgi:hypothetical protein
MCRYSWASDFITVFLPKAPFGLSSGSCDGMSFTNILHILVTKPP